MGDNSGAKPPKSPEDSDIRFLKKREPGEAGKDGGETPDEHKTNQQALQRYRRLKKSEIRSKLKSNSIESGVYYDKSIDREQEKANKKAGKTTYDRPIKFGKPLSPAAAERQYRLDKVAEWGADNHIFVKRFVELIKARGGSVPQNIDPSIEAGTATSKAAEENAIFYERYITPFIEKLHALRDALIKDGVAGYGGENDWQDIINEYVIAKHAPERNRKICIDEIAERAKDKTLSAVKKLYEEKLDKLIAESKVLGDNMDFKAELAKLDEWRKKVDDVIEKIAINRYDTLISHNVMTEPITEEDINVAPEIISKAIQSINRSVAKILKDGNNRSGFTDADARALTNAIEKGREEQCASLSRAIKHCTDYIVDKWEKYGLIPKGGAEVLKNMYKYYVPLRGWAEQEDIDYSGEIRTSYYGSNTNLYKRAKGRESLAADPLAYIWNMALCSNNVGARNVVYQKLFKTAELNARLIGNFVDFNTIYTILDETGKEAGISYEKPPQYLWDENRVRVGIDRNYRWHKTPGAVAAHEVIAFIDGVPYKITLKGTFGLHVAAGIKGINRKDAGNMLKNTSRVTRFIASAMTSKNPYFILRNAIRDVQGGERVFYQITGHILPPSTLARSMKTILAHFIGDRSVSPSSADAKSYEEFRRLGGPTGFMHNLNVDKLAEKIRREVKAMDKGVSYRKVFGAKTVFNTVVDVLDMAGEVSEQYTRFAAYLEMRNLGASPEDAIQMAKEITVNFNRMGTAAVPKALYVFMNPRLQALYREIEMSGLGDKEKGHIGRLVASLVVLNLVSFLYSMLLASDTDEKEDGTTWYDRISDYNKMSNFIIPLPSDETKIRYIGIPKGQEVRALGNLGTLTTEVVHGRKTIPQAGKQYATDLIGEFSVLDLNGIETGKDAFGGLIRGLTPSVAKPVVEIAYNKDFLNRPIYKDNPYNTTAPGYMKAYPRTNPILVDATRWLNDLGVREGDEGLAAGTWYDEKGTEHTNILGLLNLNPAVIEHLAESYFGGYYRIGSDILNTASQIISRDEDVNINNVPFVNIFYKDYSYTPKGWIQLNNEIDKMNDNRSNLNKRGNYQKANEIKNSSNYQELKRIQKKYKKDIDRLKDELLDVQDDERREELEDAIYNLQSAASREYNALKESLVKSKK